MVSCGWCSTKNFIPDNLEPFVTVPCTKCSHPVMLPVPLRQFELRGVIASGGMGTVFRAFDVNLEREVALKMMKREMAQDPEVLASFYREARAGASLNHTNIIHIYTFEEFEGQPYLVMELADHGSLDSWIERDGRVPELDVLDVGIQLAKALDSALQQQSLLHRDIKPSNILFNVYGEPKLVDFGLARASEEEDADPSAVWGTPDYVAPEKIRREGETFLSDMYSLGGTLYHALIGRPPFEGNMETVIEAHVYTPLTPPDQVEPDITQPTSEAITRIMAKDPADRFQSYDDLIMAMENARSLLLVATFKAGRSAQGRAGKSWWRR
jgi:eukaryotic-like serine/threonine-protein kinase